MEQEKNNIKFIDTTGLEINNDSVINLYKTYDINDCVLVRTTDVFPMDKIIETPINGNAYGFGDSSILGDIIYEKVRKNYPKHSFDLSEGELFSCELQNYKVCFETCRQTIHFTLNGLVGSTAYGNFDNKPYVIFEPLKYHLDESLKGLRVEDVYFNDNMVLSNEATILISQQNFDKISNNLDYLEVLEKFNVYLYKGNQQVAVAKVLNELGYDSFLISSNGYVNGLDSDKAASQMYNFVCNFAKQNSFSQDLHFYSEINREDIKKRQEKSIEIDKQHIIYILNNSNVREELKNIIMGLLDYPQYLSAYTSELEKFVDEVGLENIKRLTLEFNNLYIESLNKSKNKSK